MSEWLKKVIITIDGPAGVGKSTISRRIAAELGFTYLDTGAMYRGVAWYLQQLDINTEDENAVAASLDSLVLDLFSPENGQGEVGVCIDGKDISAAIRSPEMSMAASAVSRLPVVRRKLTMMQQIIGEQGAIVAEGRDTGTVVFPHAAFKFFLDAAPTERAHRRVLQLRARGEAADEQDILRQTIERDKNDRERNLAPLCKADDALAIDTTDLSIDDVCRVILETVENGQCAS